MGYSFLQSEIREIKVVYKKEKYIKIDRKNNFVQGFTVHIVPYLFYQN